MRGSRGGGQDGQKPKKNYAHALPRSESWFYGALAVQCMCAIAFVTGGPRLPNWGSCGNGVRGYEYMKDEFPEQNPGEEVFPLLERRQAGESALP